jgi:glycine cleavage system aminomethyltransferase T
MFGHTLGASLGLGYVAREGQPVDPEWLAGARYEVEIAGERIPARLSLRPFYDPAGERVKS